MEGTTAHLQLAIEQGSDPIRGSVAAVGEEARRFNGWIELAEAIEAVRSNSSGHGQPLSRAV